MKTKFRIMKTKINTMKIKKNILMLIAIFGLLVSCQKEESQFIDDSNEDTVTANSVTTTLLTRVSQNPGSWDDLIDDSPCAALVYPVTVIANGQEIILQSVADIAQVAAVFDQFPNDNDVLEIVFPITVQLWDYTLVTVNNQSDLQDIIDTCASNPEANNEITCIDFVYPLTIFTYNTQQEQTGTVTITNNQDLLLFLLSLDENTLYSIDFPISVIVNGETQQVNSTQELQNLIEQCDSSDDTPSDDPVAFETNLTTDAWYVTYYFDDFDETSDFQGYQFTFASDGNATAQNGTNTVEGIWDYIQDSNPKLDLFFGETNPFDELDEDWEIIEYDENIIRLRDISGDGSVDYLTFEREPSTTGSNDDLNTFIDYLTTDPWYVNLLDDDGDNETCLFVTYQFNFSTSGTVEAVSDTNVVNGFWTASISSNGGLELIINMDTTGANAVFEELNDDWDVLEATISNINLQDISGGNGGTDLLNFGRDPYTDCSSGGTTATDVENILMDGQWVVASYFDDGNNETADFNGYVVTFNTDGSVEATNGTNTNTGTWSVVNNSGNLDLILDFGVALPFEEFNDDWDIIDVLTNRIELQDISGGNGGTDDLVFEKL